MNGAATTARTGVRGVKPTTANTAVLVVVAVKNAVNGVVVNAVRHVGAVTRPFVMIAFYHAPSVEIPCVHRV